MPSLTRKSDNSIAIKRGGKLAKFDPEKSKEIVSVLSAAIKHAKEMRDWEAAWDAAQWMIDEQKQFVAWWRRTVTKRGQVGSGRKLGSADLRHLISQEQAEAKTKIKHQQISRWDKHLKYPDYKERLVKPSYLEAMAYGAPTRGTEGTGENEWFTPRQFLTLVREVLGEIDLDPASSDEAQEIVKATEYFTSDNSGLAKEWHGRVFLNPPYAQPLIAEFVAKMVDEVTAKHVSQAIMLTHNYTDTDWFHAAAKTCAAICFTRGRVKFYKSNGEVAAPTQGQAFFYFGDDPNKFAQVFDDVGFVVQPYTEQQ